MAGDSTISIGVTLEESVKGINQLKADVAELRKLMQASAKETQKMQKGIFSLAASSTILRSTSSAVSDLQNALSSLTQESVEFNKAMRAANTMAGKDEAGFKALKKDITALSKEIPIARDQLANGLYQVISNGVPEDNWIEYLNASAQAAVGGIADINKVVGVTATVIKNYGLEWSAAQDIQDKIQLTAKNGVTSFEQLAEALPTVKIHRRYALPALTVLIEWSLRMRTKSGQKYKKKNLQVLNINNLQIFRVSEMRTLILNVNKFPQIRSRQTHSHNNLTISVLYCIMVSWMIELYPRKFC